jgi:hypothetical protein
MEPKKKLWFKAKRYGWGWYPASWEGWLILLAYVTLIVRDFTEVDASSHSGSDTLIGVAPRFVIATAALIAIAYVRGEKPRWRWGKD